MRKYELTEETIMADDNLKLYRIRALKDFSNVKAGDLGGYVESENNLSQEGDCWIYDKAVVSGSARVYGSAQVYGSAVVSNKAEVYGSAKVFGNAWIFGSIGISGYERVSGKEEIS